MQFKLKNLIYIYRTRMKAFNTYIAHLLSALILCLLATSCVTPKKVNYLQDMQHATQIDLENRFEATIAPFDELDILVSSYNAELSKPFNVAGGGNAGHNFTYLVDIDGNIEYPVLGKMHVAGMTRLQLQDTITARLKAGGYIEDPYVMVRFFNFKIFFLGADGGKAVTIPNERCTFLEALALSGDLSIYTRRDKIAVMREVDGKMTTRYLDPRSSSVFSDPYFMLQQNDMIITQSSNIGTTRNEVSYWLGWVTTATSLASLLVSALLYSQLKVTK